MDFFVILSEVLSVPGVWGGSKTIAVTISV